MSEVQIEYIVYITQIAQRVVVVVVFFLHTHIGYFVIFCIDFSLF